MTENEDNDLSDILLNFDEPLKSQKEPEEENREEPVKQTLESNAHRQKSVKKRQR